ncbi:hypothetical protein CapIbe_023272 [Capra ibex]
MSAQQQEESQHHQEEIVLRILPQENRQEGPDTARKKWRALCEHRGEPLTSGQGEPHRVQPSPPVSTKGPSATPQSTAEYHTKEPTTKDEILNVVLREDGHHFPEAFCQASECLQLVFGVDVREVDRRKLIYMLVPTLSLACNGMAYAETSKQHVLEHLLKINQGASRSFPLPSAEAEREEEEGP